MILFILDGFYTLNNPTIFFFLLDKWSSRASGGVLVAQGVRLPPHRQGVKFINILQAAFVQLFSCQKIQSQTVIRETLR